MHEQLKLFCKAWLEWAESPEAALEEHEIFSQTGGLCSNFYFWLEVHDPKLMGLADGFLRLLFKSQGLDGEYPFGGSSTYLHERVRLEIHKNPERLAWARKHSC